jgi:hypothetical protein
LERAARLDWSYDGRSYSLSNNCAVETFKLLHDGMPRLSREHLASITPTGLLHRLERAGIADNTTLLPNPATYSWQWTPVDPRRTHDAAVTQRSHVRRGLHRRRVGLRITQSQEPH